MYISIFFLKLFTLWLSLPLLCFIKYQSFQSSFWSYLLCDLRNAKPIPHSTTNISIFFLKLFTLWPILLGFLGRLNLEFQSSFWSYLLCDDINDIIEIRDFLKFQSSFWSYLLCDLWPVLFWKVLSIFQSSFWSYLLCDTYDITPYSVVFYDFNLLFEAIYSVTVQQRQLSI